MVKGVITRKNERKQVLVFASFLCGFCVYVLGFRLFLGCKQKERHFSAGKCVKTIDLSRNEYPESTLVCSRKWFSMNTWMGSNLCALENGGTAA